MHYIWGQFQFLEASRRLHPLGVAPTSTLSLHPPAMEAVRRAQRSPPTHQPWR
jgi:hypothetical protein